MAINTKFRELIYEIEASHGNDIAPRGLKVKEALITGFMINPKTSIVDFEARPFNWKYFAGELLWYLSRKKETEVIDKFSSFWKNIKNPDGTVNSNYGRILFGKQMNWVINSLKMDKNSRQAIAYVGGPEYQFAGNKDFVCTQYIIFFIRQDQLHMKVQMRSNDIFYGLTYDAPFFSTVHQSVYLNLVETYPELQLGQYFHFSDNTHYYERHFELAQQIMEEPALTLPFEITLKEPLFWANDLMAESVTYSESARKYITEVDANLDKIKDLTTEDYQNLLKILFDIKL